MRGIGTDMWNRRHRMICRALETGTRLKDMAEQEGVSNVAMCRYFQKYFPVQYDQLHSMWEASNLLDPESSLSRVWMLSLVDEGHINKSEAARRLGMNLSALLEWRDRRCSDETLYEVMEDLAAQMHEKCEPCDK